jgi:hypothetical protein
VLQGTYGQEPSPPSRMVRCVSHDHTHPVVNAPDAKYMSVSIPYLQLSGLGPRGPATCPIVLFLFLSAPGARSGPSGGPSTPSQSQRPPTAVSGPNHMYPSILPIGHSQPTTTPLSLPGSLTRS